MQLHKRHLRALAQEALASRLRSELKGRPGDVIVDPVEGTVIVRRNGGDGKIFFDTDGRIDGFQSPAGRRWRFKVDSHGRVTELTTPSGQRTVSSYSADGTVRTFSRDQFEIARFRFEPKLHSAVASFPDGTNRTVSFAGRSASTVTDRLGHTDAFRYNRIGELVETQDGNGHSHQFDFDVTGRLRQLTYPDGSSESYRWSAQGDRADWSRPTGDRLHLATDEDGRLLSLEADGSILVRMERVNGRIAYASTPDGSVRFEYDQNGDVIAECRESDCIQAEFGDVGRITRLTYPSGDATTFSYDADRRVEAIVDWSGGVHKFSYSTDDLRVLVRHPNGLTCDTQLSADGRPVAAQLSGEGKTGTANLNWRFRYDAEGRLVELRDETTSIRYKYDVESQLVGTEAGGFRQEFMYDAAGNRTSVNDITATFNSLNQLLRQGNNRCEYDRRGNLIRTENRSQIRTFEYDLRDQLTVVTSKSSQTRFCYDAFGRRTLKRSGSRETVYRWWGEQLVSEETSDGTRLLERRDYLYLPDTLIPLAIRINGALYCCHTDHIGAVRAVTNPAGIVVWQADYDAFGEAKITINDIEQNLRSPGQYFDDETGLHYNRFRYYSPEFGRYLTRDPLGLRGGLNLYNYVGNDPVNSVDPLGLWSWKAVGAGLVTAVAVVALAPVTGPLLVLAAGVAAGAAFYSVNEAVENPKATAGSIALQGLKGMVVGAVSSVPFMLAMPAGAGYIMAAGAGLASGELGYVSDWALSGCNAKDWSNEGFLMSALVGAILAPAATAVARGVKSLRAGWEAAESGPKPGEPAAEPSELTEAQAKEVEDYHNAKNKAEKYPGHGHERHGAQTTTREQTTRVQSGEAPDGNTAPTKKATKFDSHAKEVEAVEKAKAQNPGQGEPKFRPDGRPNRVHKVVDDGPEGYGEGVEVKTDSAGKPLPGRPVQSTGRQPNAKVIFEYNPETDTWEPLTQYPTDEPVTP